ncbi:hypothetical protein [Paenalcaligenes faecalis]|uniref:hypothetical protein n=1 Tax=Paenalcaligenes faecalis TaxID=2980099 RepID=UPI0022B9B935|nr:hypothetical protein [Paenalcaligenes faecalis]
MTPGLVIDTNLLLLLVVGQLDEGRYISKSEKLGIYSKKDFNNLLLFMGQYKAVFFTPYIATEVSNLIGFTGNVKARAMFALKSILEIFEEIPTNTKQVVNTKGFERFGVADTSLIEVVRKYHVLTHDDPLLHQLYAIKPENVIPFESLRIASGKRRL